MRALLDTNVVSELRKSRPDPAVDAWARTTDLSDLYLSAVTVGEIQTGIHLLGRRDAAQAARLGAWLRRTVRQFSDRVLPVDTSVALAAAELHVPDRRPANDAYLAATALVHDLVVVTRNTRDFAGLGLEVLNPWEG
ncbi:twitching motility protein PilT [Cellulomonas chitinilytica]|uniref:Ribonuclease VapC n=1 Tax=Cellulomonas chitinilytica TaxID=398759 RepID=A0A919P667_9CELL|nr:type II toxin-antitoxin system VapC family toxin [Cellulomonas chitinilytica]GIG23470.1 twitching motility protein PilT [Cellulomonas chitinilytica]